MAKYKAYPEYKDSGVEWLGEIPSHWTVVPCRSVVNHIVEKNEAGHIKNYLSLMANIGVIPYEEKGDIGNKKPDDIRKCKIVKKGHLVINSMNYSLGSYGLSPYNGICSSVYIILEIKNNFLNGFIFRIFESSTFQKYLSSFGNGILAHRAAISWDDIKWQYLAMPSIAEQRKLISFLKYECRVLDTLLNKLEQLIEVLKEKRMAVISHTVTKGLNPDVPMKDSGVEWLDKVPTHWLKTSIKYTTKLNPVKKSLESSLYEKCSFIPMEKLKLGRIILDKIKVVKEVYHAYTYFENDDILIAKVTPCFENKNFAIAKNLVNGLGFGSTEIYVLRCNSSISNEFVFYRLQESNFSTIAERAMTGAGGLKRVPSEVVSSFKYFLPSLIEQQEIASFLNSETKKIDTLIQKQLQQIDLLKERRTALISAAVTGKIDLRDWTPPASSTESSHAAEEATA